MKRITTKTAAKIMNCSDAFVRIGMQRGVLDIGECMKTSSVYTYCISPAKLAARQGMTIEQLEEEVDRVCGC